jgi:hypothetical protein
VINAIFDGFGGNDSQPMLFPVRPMDCTIHRNSYRQADSWEFTCPADDFPIDPQLIRSMTCDVYMYQTNDLEDVLATRKPPADQASRDPFAEFVQTKLDRLGTVPTPQIAGIADEITVEYTSGGKQVRVTGQDYTDYLIRKQWPPLPNGKPKRIPVGKRLDKLMASILAEADPTNRLRIDVRGIEASTLPVVKTGDLGTHERGIPVETDTSYWDVLYGLASRSGYICFVLGLDVVLTKPQIFSAENRGRPLLLTWGRNLETLEMTRTMSKEKVPQIIMIGYDPKTQKRVEVRYPEGKQKVPAPGTLGVEEDEYQIIPVYGVTDKTVLKNMAEGRFNLIGRGERTVRLSTRDLKDSTNADGNDLLNASAGTPAIIDFDEFNIDEKLLIDESVTTSKKYDYLVSKGYSENVAGVMAQHYLKLQALKRPMRIKEITFTFSASDGISIEAELNDYVVVDGTRNSADKPTRAEKAGK